MNLAHVYPHQRPPKRGSRPRARSPPRCAAAASRARSDKTSRRPSSGRRVLWGGRLLYKRRRAARRRRLVVVLSARAWAVLVVVPALRAPPRAPPVLRAAREAPRAAGSRATGAGSRTGRARRRRGPTAGPRRRPRQRPPRGGACRRQGRGSFFRFYRAARRRKSRSGSEWPILAFTARAGRSNAEQQAVAVLDDLLLSAECL